MGGWRSSSRVPAAPAPHLATGWMWLSNPRRIVINAERMDELGATLAERTRTAQSGRD